MQDLDAIIGRAAAEFAAAADPASLEDAKAKPDVDKAPKAPKEAKQDETKPAAAG